MRNLCETLVSAVDASVTVYSAALDAQQLYALSAQAKFSSATLAGAFKIQASNDPLAATNWSDVSASSQTVASGALTLIPMQQLSYRWVRLAWVPSAGSGNITVTINAQGF